MKSFYIVLFFLLISEFNSESCNSVKSPKKPDDCKDKDLGDKEYVCCYFEYNGKNGTEDYKSTNCAGLKKDQFEDIKGYFEENVNKTKESGIDVTYATINCFSNYLSISILSLILLFLF